jgi:ectoine hydroxylase-related dioxygenase (phytanoyl-CoA dioxygenase family)
LKDSTNSTSPTASTTSSESKESSTTTQTPQAQVTASMTSNEYFLWSGDHIGYFFEENAFNQQNELIYPLNKSINKIGHTLHRDDNVFAAFSSSPAIQNVARDIGFTKPLILQSMVICKQPQIGGRVDVHRDSTFLYTIPSSAVGFWFALEDCTIENGCLAFVPGSHLDAVSTRRMVRKGPMQSSINNRAYVEQLDKDSNKLSTIDAIAIGSIADFDKNDGPLNKGTDLQFIGEDNANYPEDAFVSLPVPKGTLIVIHGDVVHRSAPNHSLKSRNIYTFHLIEGDNLIYPVTNWLQSSQPFSNLISNS